jgi:hypothetical protein
MQIAFLFPLEGEREREKMKKLYREGNISTVGVE